MKVIEAMGTINKKGFLKLDKPIKIKQNEKVKVIILLKEEDIEEKLWLKALNNNASFEFLKAQEEDIYSLKDGEPFND